MRRGQVFPLEPLTGLLGFLGAKRNLAPGGALRRLVTRNVVHECLEDLPIPLHVVACDVLTGSEVLLSRGPLVDAVLASAAIPGVLPPIEWEGRLLIDGGVVDVQPMDFGHAETLMSRAEADAGAFLDGRARTVVPLPSRRRRRRAAPDALAELPPAS